MMAVILWYLAITALGWLAFPVGYRLLRFLPDRAFGVAKALGLLLFGYCFWLPASLHLVGNDPGGILLSLGILAALSWLAGRGRWAEMRAWLGANKRVWITAEVLFLLAFALWAAMRAASPDATGTEKPMELAFINAILSSPQFPPHDPWLSGYAISYYYFGYVIVALLAKLTGTLGSVAFNLGVASWFGLAASAGYSVLYNLLETGRRENAEPARRQNHLVALLAPVFILLAGNFGGLLETMYGAGFFWQKTDRPVTAFAGEFPPAAECLTSSDAGVNSAFWRWLDIQEWNCPPVNAPRFGPNRAGWWWWRSSRVLSDYDLNNGRREVIDEFPAFSYLLGDLHPHVLSMPFVLLAAALALNIYLRGLKGELAGQTWQDWPRQAEFWLAGVALGGLAFLNIWDFPIYLALYAAAFGLARVTVSRRWSWAILYETLRLGVLLGILGVLAYIPFYLGFASQAGGLTPSLSFFTRGIHFWVMFGTLLIPILLWVYASWRGGNRRVFLRGLGIAAALVFGLWLLSYLLGGILLALPGFASTLISLQGGVEAGMILPGSLARRLVYPGMWLSLLGILTVIITQLLRQTGEQDELVLSSSTQEESAPPVDAGRGFTLLLILLACGLVLFPEFFYLRDQFGWRMNTIFKFYYQAWILLALAAAYGFAWLWGSRRGILLGIPAALVLTAALLFSTFGIQERLFSGGFQSRVWSLDGANYIRLGQPDLYGAIEWLRAAPRGVVAEAVGGSYQAEYARIATHSGQPGVLGWPGHEGQWRGGYTEVGSREPDLNLLYVTPDWDQAKEMLLRYSIRYVVVGPAEYNRYGDRVRQEKFIERLALVYDSPQVRIFEVPADLK
jgi:YYY domain-containing protein